MDHQPPDPGTRAPLRQPLTVSRKVEVRLSFAVSRFQRLRPKKKTVDLETDTSVTREDSSRRVQRRAARGRVEAQSRGSSGGPHGCAGHSPLAKGLSSAGIRGKGSHTCGPHQPGSVWPLQEATGGRECLASGREVGFPSAFRRKEGGGKSEDSLRKKSQEIRCSSRF